MLTAKGAATRQRIVESAARLIRDRGPAKVGLDDIRADTSTSKSQLFHYFPDGKADLLLAVARHEAEQVLAEQQPMLGDLTSWPKWEAWRQRVIEKYDAQRDKCPLTALTAQLNMADPAVREIITELYEEWQGHIAAGVRALKESGETAADIDVDNAAIEILTAITGGAAMLQATGRMSYLEVSLRESVNALRRPAPAATDTP
ncbi:TetR/AcrR family transcriptional regulator [Streptomyces sp. NBC_00872]|uniref:TetR/AcrR family transcriptional regulator n=1 Tax=Streptomyces sp. NBC_00872 TaxID=2903686 RepID=UPI00386D4D7D|nr:TetR/AcrR family transcriptional regulator [Streptomyces sp. NBC_00872]